MIKRASTILLTLFLLLTSTQVWAQYVTDITVAETSFETKTGSYPCKISEIKCKNPSNESYSTSLQYVASDPSSNGTYSINNGTLSIKHNQTGDSNVLLAGNIGGLVSAAGYNNYKIYIKLASGGDFQVRCQTYYNNNDHNQVDKGPGNTIEIDATCVGGSVSFSLFFNWVNSGTLRIESIKVVGASEKKVISSESPAVCSGKETTLSGLGSTSTSYQWSVSDDNVNYTPIPGATQSTYTVSVTEPKYYKLNDIPGTLVYPVLCCSDNTVGANISETFKMSTASTAFEDLAGLSRIDNNSYTHASSSPIGDGFYAIVHKAKDGGHWSNSPVQAKSLTIDSKDGFLLVNCSKSDHGKAMYMRLFENLCPNTLYKFSASVANVDMKASDLGIDVKFDVIAKEGPKNGQSLLPEPISVSVACGNSTWIDKSISFVTSGCTKVEVRLYNNVENPTGKGGNDVGLDDITFGLCTPEIALYSNDGWTAKDREICPDDEPNTYISVGSAMNLDDILPGQKYYYFEYKDGNTWKAVAGNNPTTDNKIKVDIQETTHASGMLYRAWVAGDAGTVVNAAKGNVNTCTAYAQSDAITLTYKCTTPSIKSNAPEMNNYLECPTTADKIDLKTLIKSIKLVDGTAVDLNNISNSGELTWKKADGSEFTDTNVPFPRQGETDTYTVQFTQKNDATANYRISDPTTFTVGIKGAIDLYIIHDNLLIEYCTKEFAEAREFDRTFHTDNIGNTLPAGTEYTWTDENGNILQQSTEDSYTLPLDTHGRGKITVTAKDPNNSLCPSKPVSGEYNIIKTPTFDLTINIPCKDQLSTTGVKLDFTNIDAEKKDLATGFIEINRVTDGSYSDTEFITYNEETEITWNDIYDASANPTKVRYEVYFATNSNYVVNNTGLHCFTEAFLPSKEEYYDITDTNQFTLTSDADKKTVGDGFEYHICKGTDLNYHIISDYQLKAGKEFFKWYRDGEYLGDDLKYSNSYKITEMSTAQSVFKVVIEAEPNEESCGGEATVTIYGDDAPSVEMSNIEICYGQNTSLSAYGGDSYTWSPSTYLSNVNIANPTVTQPQDDITYTVKVEKGVCSKDFTVDVIVNELPVINTIDVKTEENGERDITVNVSNGESPYKYSLDGENYDVLDVILERASIGWNKLYVIDANECGSDKMFEVDPIEIRPEKYFSPNNDGVNEKWEVINLNTYSSYIVEIFTRHGKRIFIQRVGSFNIGGVDDGLGDAFTGWDGIYNGKPMPSDDYWYLITVEDIRKQYTGHFTLKR